MPRHEPRAQFIHSKFAIRKRGRSILPWMDETQLRRRKRKFEFEWAIQVRRVIQWIRIYYPFFFLFSLFFHPFSSSNLRAHGQKKIASLSRDSGSRTCAHAQFMQVGIRGWKVAPIDSNFSSFFIKIIPPRLEGRNRETFSKESRRRRRIHHDI